MFGLIYAIIIICAVLISGIKCAVEEQEQITKAKKRREEGNNKYNLYTDRLGHTRDLRTGQLRMMDYISCEQEGEEQYLRDIYGNPVRNLSEERRLERRIEAANDPRRTVFFYKEGPDRIRAGSNGRPYYSGKQYKDLKTGQVYVCRRIEFPREISPNGGSGVFYMDVSNGLLVREADRQIFDRTNGKYKFSEEQCKQFIELFNEKQREGGYAPMARSINKSGWKQNESELDKCVRMKAFYFNNKECIDEP